jgi:hypothetical protein
LVWASVVVAEDLTTAIMVGSELSSLSYFFYFSSVMTMTVFQAANKSSALLASKATTTDNVLDRTSPLTC